MSGRSVLCDLWFSQTLRHKNGISIYMSIYLPKTKKFGCVGRGDLTSLFFSKVVEILEVRGDLSISVENKKSYRVDRQACKHYALALTLCAFNNSKSI